MSQTYKKRGGGERRVRKKVAEQRPRTVAEHNDQTTNQRYRPRTMAKHEQPSVEKCTN